jgi:hypothetical protein
MGEEPLPVITSYELVTNGYDEHSAAIVFRGGDYRVARLAIEQWSGLRNTSVHSWTLLTMINRAARSDWHHYIE